MHFGSYSCSYPTCLHDEQMGKGKFMYSPHYMQSLFYFSVANLYAVLLLRGRYQDNQSIHHSVDYLRELRRLISLTGINVPEIPSDSDIMCLFHDPRAAGRE